MIMLNLFIGVITNSMSEMHKELDVEQGSEDKRWSPRDGVAGNANSA
jgi:hypothetical protein